MFNKTKPSVEQSIPPSPFTKLPDELYIEIIKFIPLNDIVNLLLVNKNLNELAEKILSLQILDYGYFDFKTILRWAHIDLDLFVKWFKKNHLENFKKHNYNIGNYNNLEGKDKKLYQQQYIIYAVYYYNISIPINEHLDIDKNLLQVCINKVRWELLYLFYDDKEFTLYRELYSLIHTHNDTQKRLTALKKTINYSKEILYLLTLYILYIVDTKKLASKHEVYSNILKWGINHIQEVLPQNYDPNQKNKILILLNSCQFTLDCVAKIINSKDILKDINNPKGIFINLSGIDLQKVDLQGSNLQKTNLHGVNLKEAKLQKANLQGANLQYAKLQKANLQGANLQYANLQWANLQYANLQKANLQKTNLQHANLKEVDLRHANLQWANLQWAKLQWVNLQYADLRYTNLQWADLSDTDLQNADLRYANLQGANLSDADLQNADLRYANLQGAYLRKAKLQGAYLRKAKLQGTNLEYADLQKAKLQGTNLQYANLQEAKLQKVNLQGANLQYANLQKANLQGADLQKADLQNAFLYKANLTHAKLNNIKINAQTIINTIIDFKKDILTTSIHIIHKKNKLFKLIRLLLPYLYNRNELTRLIEFLEININLIKETKSIRKKDKNNLIKFMSKLRSHVKNRKELLDTYDFDSFISQSSPKFKSPGNDSHIDTHKFIKDFKNAYKISKVKESLLIILSNEIRRKTNKSFLSFSDYEGCTTYLAKFFARLNFTDAKKLLQNMGRLKQNHLIYKHIAKKLLNIVIYKKLPKEYLKNLLKISRLALALDKHNNCKLNDQVLLYKLITHPSYNNNQTNKYDKNNFLKFINNRITKRTFLGLFTIQTKKLALRDYLRKKYLDPQNSEVKHQTQDNQQSIITPKKTFKHQK